VDARIVPGTTGPGQGRCPGKRNRIRFDQL